jgi:hypothetical protein
MVFYAKSWRPDKACPNQPLLPGDSGYGHIHTNDVRFRISSLQAFLFIYPLFNLVDYACENKIIMGSRCLDSNLLNNILVSIIIHD